MYKLGVLLLFLHGVLALYLTPLSNGAGLSKRQDPTFDGSNDDFGDDEDGDSKKEALEDALPSV